MSKLALTCFLFALIVPLGSCHRDAYRAALPTLSTCGQLRHLPASEARRGYPVHLHGTVTFYDAEYRLLTIQDQTGGVYVDSKEQELDNVVPGITLDVEGYSAFEEYDPVVVKARVRVGSRSAIPAPRRVPIRNVVEGLEDFQFVEVEGRLRSVSFGNNVHLRFAVEQKPFELEAIVSTQTPMPEWPAGTPISVRGVASVLRDAQGTPRSARLHVSSIQDIRTKTPLPQPPALSTLPGPGLPLLTQVNQVKGLTLREASKRYPVRILGVVNLHSLTSQTLLLQDSTGGVYVTLLTPLLDRLAPGTQVEVEGVSHPGDFAPSIHQASVRVLSPGHQYPPLEISDPDSLAVSAENRWARIRGVARAIRSLPNPAVQIDLEVMGRHFPIDVLGAPNSGVDDSWIDEELEIEGVLGALFDENRRLQGFHLMVPSREFVKVTLRAPADPFGGTSPPIGQLHEFQNGENLRHRLKVAGTVTATRLGGKVFLASGAASLRLQANGDPKVRVGDRIEAVGFLSLGAKLPALEHAVLRTLGPGSPQRALPSYAEDLMTGATDTGLVSLEARLVDRQRSYGDEILILRAGKTRFTAVLAQPQPVAALGGLRPGSMLRLTGVCDMAWDWARVPPEPVSFTLLLRTPADITVVRMASWWTAHNTLGVLASVCGLLLVVLAWVFELRRRVKRQAAMLATRLERETQLQAQLVESRKLESVGRLAGGVAHDFNNLLTVINGYSDLVLVRLQPDNPLHPQVEQIRRAGERAAALTQQLLGFSRKQVIQPRPINLNDAVTEARNTLQPLLGNRIAVHAILDPALDLVVADPLQIDQILMNLTANARDAMPNGGTLTIETQNLMVLHQGRNAAPDVPPGNYVVLSVTDTGAGMSPETLQHLFEPFFTTKEQGRGTGLGLATVYGIVKQNGGWIGVRSVPAQGSAFQVYFPSHATGGESTTPREPAPVVPASACLLVVEDEEDVRGFAVEVLQSRGYSVLTSQDAESALLLADNSTEPIHLLVTDVVLPGINGRELAKRLKAKRPTLRVLFTSGYTRDLIADRGILEPGTDYLAKPYTPDELTAKVNEILSKPPGNPA